MIRWAGRFLLFQVTAVTVLIAAAVLVALTIVIIVLVAATAVSPTSHTMTGLGTSVRSI